MDELLTTNRDFDSTDDLLNTGLIMEDIRTMSSKQWSVFLAGLVLFVSAKPVAHRAVTFYASSAVFGVLFSIAFLAMFIRKLLPKRIFMIPVDMLGAPALSYLYYYGYSHAQEILRQNWKLLAVYVAVAVLASLTICYVSDVASNVRVQNVLQWSLQFVSVLMLFYSSQNVPLAIGAILIIVAIEQGAHRYIWQLIKWLTKKPKTRPLITMEEYERQGADFTKMELEKLRISLLEDCRYSPNRSLIKRCKTKDQMTSFLLGSQDVSMQSQLAFQKEFNKTDDEYVDEDDLMEVDSGTEENLFLSDDEY